MAENTSIYDYDESDDPKGQPSVVPDVDIEEDELQQYEPPEIDREQLSKFQQYEQKKGGE